MTEFVETPEGQRIVEAMARALYEGPGVPSLRWESAPPDARSNFIEAACDALRAALSVTGECKTCATCGGLARGQFVGEPCENPECEDGMVRGEPLLVLREQR